jgi:hypothetical protein
MAPLLGVALVAIVCLAGCSTASPADHPPTAGVATTAPGATAPYAMTRVRLAGTLGDQKGSSWTLAGDDGQRYTLTISERTRFGTRQTPMKAEQFHPGSRVRVSGMPHGDAVLVTQISPTN